MAFKRDDRVTAARKALKGAKKSARDDRRSNSDDDALGLFDAEGEAERKDQIQAGRELAVARGVRPGTERPAPMFENIPKEFDPDFEDEFVMEGETTKQAPFKGAGGYSYTQNAAGDYEFVGPDGKKGVAKKGTKAHASIFSEMTGKGSLYKKTGSSGGASSRSAPAQTTPAAPGGFTGPTLAMLEGGESEVENTFGASSEYGDEDIRLDAQSPLTEDDMQVRLVYDALPADASTAITNSLRTLGSRRRTKDDPLGSARGEGYALSTEKRAAFNTILPFLEDKIDSSMPSGKASRNFRSRVAGAALQRIDFDAIADGADPNAEIDKAIAVAQRRYPEMMAEFREQQDAATRRSGGYLSPGMSPNTRAKDYSAFGAFEYGKEGFTDLRNQAARVAAAREEEEARQGRAASGGQVLE